MRRDRQLSVAERMDARAALEILEGSGISLQMAAALAAGRSTGCTPTLVTVAVDGFLKHCLSIQLRAATVASYEQRLNLFVSFFGGRVLDDVSRAEFKGWLEGLPGAHGSRMATLRAVRRLYNWAGSREPRWCGQNPCAGLQLAAPRGERVIDFLSVDEAVRVIGAAGPYAPAMALMLFAGIRPHEIRGTDKTPLDWAAVDFAARVVRVPAEIAKTRVARALEGLPDNLWAWLRLVPRAERTGPIAPGRSRQAIRIAREAIGRPWPKDALRHSFATYHVALLNDVGRTSLLMGHEGAATMLHRHYRGVASRAEAKRFFEIRPAD